MKKTMALVTMLWAAQPVCAFADVVTFHVDMSGKMESPPNASTGKGEAIVTFDVASRKATWDMAYSELSGPVVSVDFEGPPVSGSGAAVRQQLPGSWVSPMKGSVILTPDAAEDLMKGKLYLNIHTVGSKNGEIRGLIEKGAPTATG